MAFRDKTSRRRFLQAGSLVAAGAVVPGRLHGLTASLALPLDEFGYADVAFAPGPHEDQLHQSHSVLMELSDDALLKPIRQMSGKPAPGALLPGWYRYDVHYDYRNNDSGFAPAHCYGQWVSALARSYAITGSTETREKVLRLNRLFADSLSGGFFDKTRFPAYTYDKFLCGLIDSHQFAADPEALNILDRTTGLALPHMPAKAITREQVWRPGKDVSYTWDESYTLPENLFLAYKRGAGGRYRELALRYLEDETYFDPLARGENPMAGRHAYSYVNALSSAMQAYLAAGSEKHLVAAKNGFDLLAAQSFATGGWGPDEQLRKPESEDVFDSLTRTHNSFETPCGSYAHFKLTRYLLRVTRDSRYGDSMERVMYNTILGVKPLQPDGHAFYYADYNLKGKRVYSDHTWPCCAGTLPQVAADYRISSYLRDGRDVYVNLYIPSTLQWAQGSGRFSLTQEGNYPFEETVGLRVSASQPGEFAIHLRIPAWAQGASASVNGERLPGTPAAGFLRIQRQWKDGDRVELTLPMNLRLEAINPRHPETVALLRGPLVLFALGEGKPDLTQKQLLSARQIERSQWIVESAAGAVKFAPFTEVADAPYSAYLRTV